MTDFSSFVRALPKAELHLHIEGTLEPAMMMQLAAKHQVALPYSSVADVEKAYNFSDLQSFLDLYYLGASVLIDEDDFYLLMKAYLSRCHDEGVVHTEMMFDPQTHTERGIEFSAFMAGFERAMKEAESEWGISSLLIMCFLRHLSEQQAFETLKAAGPYQHQIHAIGLDSAESGHPPSKFERVFSSAVASGYVPVSHAGEEGPPDYIIEALDLLKVQRIDHGVRCLENDALVERLIGEQMPLTVCPLSNVRLCVFDQMEDHPVVDMLKRGLNVCINSDDPPYFGGYLMDNFDALHNHLSLDREQAKQLCANSIRGSFLETARKEQLLAGIVSA